MPLTDGLAAVAVGAGLFTAVRAGMFARVIEDAIAGLELELECVGAALAFERPFPGVHRGEKYPGDAGFVQYKNLN